MEQNDSPGSPDTGGAVDMVVHNASFVSQRCQRSVSAKIGNQATSSVMTPSDLERIATALW